MDKPQAFMDLNEQLLVFDRECDYAIEVLWMEIEDNMDEIIAMARERLIDGFEEYGDAMWKWDDSVRSQAWKEEAADALNYIVGGLG